MAKTVTVECSDCGRSMKTARENYRYIESGLPNVTLGDVEISRCPKCGRFEVTIPRMAALHEGLARVISRKESRLAPEEIRFLRKHLGWSGADFANVLGVAAETVSRWETGRADISNTAERLLRVLTWNQKPVEKYPVEELERIDETKSKPMKLKMALEDHEWAWRS